MPNAADRVPGDAALVRRGSGRAPGTAPEGPASPVTSTRGVADSPGIAPRHVHARTPALAEPPAPAPDAPRPLTVRRPAPGRTLARPMELRLQGRRTHGGV